MANKFLVVARAVALSSAPVTPPARPAGSAAPSETEAIRSALRQQVDAIAVSPVGSAR